MLGYNDPGINPIVQFGPLPYAPPRRFYIDPLLVLNPMFSGCLRVDLYNGIRPNFPQPGKIAVGRMEKGGSPQPGIEYIGVTIKEVRSGNRAFRNFPVTGKRVTSPLPGSSGKPCFTT